MAQSYEEAILKEDQMRLQMYSLADHLMVTQDHYDLKEVTEDSFKEPPAQEEGPFLFSERRLIPSPWAEVTTDLAQFNFLFQVPGLFIAGGRVFSALFRAPKRDVDLFICGLDQEKAKESIWKLFGLLKEKHAEDELKIIRTQNALTFKFTSFKGRRSVTEYQVVLRLYKTKSEVLHGFDVDSCCLGYDEKIWMTPRCQFALEHGYNTVNFGRLSPSYEWRLVKYATRGLPIKVPGLDPARIQWAKIDQHFKEIKSENETCGFRSMSERYHQIKGKTPLKGLAILLYMEHHCREFGFHQKMIGAVDQLADEASDYNPLPYTRYEGNGQILEEVLPHILTTSDWYPEMAAKYVPYFVGSEYNDACIVSGYIDHNLDKVLGFQTNHFLLGRSIDFISYSSMWSNLNTLKLLCNLPERLYKGLGEIRPWKIPRQLEFKVTNPGEQMTNTFHQIVLADPQVWFQSEFYVA